MFKISTKGRYGVRFMMDLAQHYGQGPVALKDVALRQEVSVKYLEHLIGPLKKARLISAQRGAYGGYSLVRPPESITLEDIVAAVEGSVCLVECTKNASACKRARNCLSRDIWSMVSQKITQTMHELTLEQMITREKRNEQSLTYSI